MGGAVVNTYKRLGETPRERIERLRREQPQYQYEVLSYAGRLDPMAEGVLLLLAGEKNKQRDQYLSLEKEYVLDILFGFSTDTYDVLGKILRSGDASHVTRAKVIDGLARFRGSFEQEYPPYSSKTVEGKSLFEWARQSVPWSFALPAHTVTVRDITLAGMYRVKESELLAYIERSVGGVDGDFRQDDVLAYWHRALRKEGVRLFPCATVHIGCSSGTYARSIANELGQHLGVPALALHILRTRVGEYRMERALR